MPIKIRVVKMKNYNLKGIDCYFDENWGFDFRDLVMDTFLYDSRYTLNCHEENLKKIFMKIAILEKKQKNGLDDM